MSIRALMNMMTAVSILILAGFFVREFVKPLQKLFFASFFGGRVSDVGTGTARAWSHHRS